MSQLFSQTRREIPAEAEIVSHQLLMRAGYIRPLAAGLFFYLPLAHRVLRRITKVMRAEMDAIGGQEICMPLINPAELWMESGRRQSIGVELGRFVDKNQHAYTLTMTNEEAATSLASEEIQSYRQLPALLYHLQTKWRDDSRPRAGLMWAREFTILDSYSFDRDENGLEHIYEAHMQAYNHIFTRCGIPFIMVESDTGVMGGQDAHKFMYLSPVGEDTIATCEYCGYQANWQTARFLKETPQTEPTRPLQKTATPGIQTIDDLAAFLDIPASRTAKAVFYLADMAAADTVDKLLVFAVIRGDMEINETKLQKAIGAINLTPAQVEDTRSYRIIAGYASPIGLDLPLVVADELIPLSPNLAAGANEEGFHYINVNYGRDYQAHITADIASAQAGRPCIHCHGPLRLRRAVEIGSIFKLGTRYSQPMKCTYLDENGAQQLVVMGSYGIGLGRLLACIAEQHHDEHGLCWPPNVAPFDVHLTTIIGKSLEISAQADEIYHQAKETGLEVLFDDRPVSPGVKFKDADLIGIPLRMTLSEKTLVRNCVELKYRRQSQSEDIPLDELEEWLCQYQQKSILKVNN